MNIALVGQIGSQSREAAWGQTGNGPDVTPGYIRATPRQLSLGALVVVDLGNGQTVHRDARDPHSWRGQTDETWGQRPCLTHVARNVLTPGTRSMYGTFGEGVECLAKTPEE